MPLGTPDRTLAQLFSGAIDLTTDTLRVALYDDTTAFTFDSSTHEFVSDVLDGGTTAQELQGTSGYTGTSDRQTIANQTVTEDNTNDLAAYDGDNITWTGVESTADIQGWIVYKQVGTDDTTPADDPLVLVVDDEMTGAPTNLPLSTNGSDITIEWATEGITRLQVV